MQTLQSLAFSFARWLRRRSRPRRNASAARSNTGQGRRSAAHSGPKAPSAPGSSGQRWPFSMPSKPMTSARLVQDLFGRDIGADRLVVVIGPGDGLVPYWIMSFLSSQALVRGVFQMARIGLYLPVFRVSPTAGTGHVPPRSAPASPSPGPGAVVVSMTITVGMSRPRGRICTKIGDPLGLHPHVRSWMPHATKSICGCARLRLSAHVVEGRAAGIPAATG